MLRSCTSSRGWAHARGRKYVALKAIQPVYAAKTIVRIRVRSYLSDESACVNNGWEGYGRLEVAKTRKGVVYELRGGFACVVVLAAANQDLDVREC